MNSLWWLALPTLLLPIWWHRKKRVQVAAEPMATARFLPRTEPRQMRVWRWADVILMILRCLLLACLRKIILLIPLIFILPHVLPDAVFGVFLAEPVSDILAATITTITFFARFDKILDRGAAHV